MINVCVNAKANKKIEINAKALHLEYSMLECSMECQ